ncbi:flippase [Methanofervidicoccus abyssi]|nr:flippase [Methanofervidicoccus abyssi]
MSEISHTLQKIMRGTGIVFAGVVISMFFGFLSRILIARNFSIDEYGVYNLALTILSIAITVATLGFPNSLPREIVFYREKDPSKINKLISTALIIVVLSSILLMVFLILETENIVQIFKDGKLSQVLPIIVFTLPFSALTNVLISISQGFGRVREKIYFQNIIYPIIYLLLVISVIFLNLNFSFIFFAYTISQIFTFLILIINMLKMKILCFELSLDLTLGKKLVVFSIPLFFAGILSFVMGWTDTLMLGYYKNSEVVGLYNSASSIARLLTIFLNSISFLYVPLVSSFYIQGKLNEMGRIYQILTKWIFSLTLPLFTLIFLFSKIVIAFFFGGRYLEASRVLEILALGFMFHASTGLNGSNLIIIGKSRLNLAGTSFAALLNIILNFVLIPVYGLEGAAIATTMSYFVLNILMSFWLYKNSKIHPFSWNYVKSLVISFILLGILKSLNLNVDNIWYAVLVSIVFVGVYFLLLLFSKSIDNEDIDLLLTVEKNLGVDLTLLKRILKKFI